MTLADETAGAAGSDPGDRSAEAVLAVGTAVFSWEWARALSGTGWVPDDRTVIAERLRLLTERAARAMLGDDVDVIAAAGRDIGAELVGTGFAAPEALGRTIELVTGRLLDDLGDRARATIRPTAVPALVAALGVGFARAVRDRTLAEQDAIRSSYLVARRRAEAAASPSPRTGTLVDHGFLAELPAALELGEIVAVYQPIVELAGGTIVGFEALARWQHPTRGVLPPSIFLPAAAEAGLLPQLGTRLRADACRAAIGWQEAAGREVFVGVNLAPVELRDPALLENVRGVLERIGLPPHLLHLEITEDAELTDADLPVLRGLAATGLQLTLDDFGTGHSRATALPYLPLQGMKLADALLEPIRRLPFEQAGIGIELMVSMVRLAERIGLTTTAEGIENAAEAELVRRLGVTRAQGWFYGRPVPVDEVPGLLTD